MVVDRKLMVNFSSASIKAAGTRAYPNFTRGHVWP